MKILQLAFAGTDQAGVHRKLAEQVVALRACGQDVESLVVADTSVAPAPAGAPYMLVDVPGGGFDAVGRSIAYSAFREAANRMRPDVVYMRYPMYDSHTLDFVRESAPVVFELQTIFANEVPAAVAEREAHWAPQVLAEAAGIVAVTGEILEYETARAGYAIPGHVMPNGADENDIPFTTPATNNGIVNVLCVASFQPWHGIDRLIVGMASEPDVTDVHLHLVGDGVTLPGLKGLVHDAGLSERVHFHGHMPVRSLGPMYERANVALGSLAPHRVGLRELAALKHREYALRGIPLVLAGGDADFPSTLPWMRQIASDDSPVSPRMLRALGHAWSHIARRGQIRAWAEANVTWAVKVPRLVEFLESCRDRAEHRRESGIVGAAR